MNLVKIKHQDERGETHYPLYEIDEAVDAGISYKDWRKCEEGEWAVTDDNIVCQVLTKKVYADNKDRKRIYYRFPFGSKVFKSSSFGRVKVEARGRDYTIIKDGTIVYKKKSDKFHENFVSAYAASFDPDIATALVHQNPTKSQITNGRKFSRTETFKKMLREELKSILSENGITENYVVDLLREAIELAREKKDITNLLRVAENFQKMMAIDQPDKTKVTNIVEATRTKRLLDKVKEEEDKLKLTQTIGGDYVEKLQEEEGSGRGIEEERIEIVQEEEEQDT